MFDLLITEKTFNFLQDCKRHLEQVFFFFFPQKDKISLRRWNYEVTLKNGRR